MTALQIIAAWCALSLAFGLLLGRMIAAAAIPPTHDDRQHGEGERVRGENNLHKGALQHD